MSYLRAVFSVPTCVLHAYVRHVAAGVGTLILVLGTDTYDRIHKGGPKGMA